MDPNYTPNIPPSNPNLAPATPYRHDHDLLVELNVRVQQLAADIKSSHEHATTRMTELHGRIVRADRFIDEYEKKDVAKKVEENYLQIRDFKQTYKVSMAIISIIAGFIGFVIKFATDIWSKTQ